MVRHKPTVDGHLGVISQKRAGLVRMKERERVGHETQDTADYEWKATKRERVEVPTERTKKGELDNYLLLLMMRITTTTKKMKMKRWIPLDSLSPTSKYPKVARP